MRLSVKRIATTLGLAAAAACGDSTGLQPEDLAGTWNVTVMEFRRVGTSEQVDLIGDLGGTGTVTITSAGGFTISLNVQGLTQTDHGTIEVDGNEVSITDGADITVGAISRAGDTVTIEMDTGVEFDFDDNGSEEPATLRMVLQKV